LSLKRRILELVLELFDLIVFCEGLNYLFRGGEVQHVYCSALKEMSAFLTGEMSLQLSVYGYDLLCEVYFQYSFFIKNVQLEI
jgi:hypothetical protein